MPESQKKQQKAPEKTSRTKPILIALGLLAIVIVVVLTGDALPASSFRYDPEKAVHSNLSGERALQHVQALVDFGPRPPASSALAESRQYIATELTKAGWFVKEDAFTKDTRRGKVSFVNVHARFGKGERAFSRTAEVIVGSHYDTKYFAAFEFVGANDGGSSTGLLIEIARVLSGNPDLAKRVELVCFDGEEAFGSNITEADGLYGSRHLAKTLRVLPEKERPPFVVIFDMVGDKNLDVGIPSNTDPEMTKRVLKAATELNHRKHFSTYGPIKDDHQPFQDSGFRTTNIIDLNYKPYWHTSRDTMDRVSAESLQITGQVGLLFIEKYLLGGESDVGPPE